MKIFRGFLLVTAVICILFSKIDASASDLPSGIIYDYESVICLLDDSWSMKNTFQTETSEILSDLSKAYNFDEPISFGSSGKTPLWKTLNQCTDYYSSIVLVSDLWCTDGEELEPSSDMEMCIFVPFPATIDSINHVDDVVYNTILSQWTDSVVTVVFWNGTRFVYTNTLPN